jgi:hypothetical protein
MARYTVALTTTASLYVTVEADNEEAAVDAAHEAAPSEVCAQCSGWNEDYDLELSGEWELADVATEEVDR